MGQMCGLVCNLERYQRVFTSQLKEDDKMQMNPRAGTIVRLSN